MKRSFHTICYLLLVYSWTIPNTPAHAGGNFYLATATPGGTFHRVGYAIAALVTEDLESARISMTAMNTDGSCENLRLLLDEQATFALLQGFIGTNVQSCGRTQNGETRRIDPEEVHRKLRLVAPVWQNVEHFSIRHDLLGADVHTMEDLATFLAERRGGPIPFSLGRPGSGTRASGRHIFSALGIQDLDSVLKLESLDYDDSAKQLIEGKIWGMNTPAGLPVAAVERALDELGEKMRVLSFSPEDLRRVNSNFNLWAQFRIGVNTYSNQNSPIDTIAQPNFLAVHTRADETSVCKITEIIFRNEKFFKRIHDSTEMMFRGDDFRTNAISGLPYELHPGAKRYFELDRCDQSSNKGAQAKEDTG